MFGLTPYRKNNGMSRKNDIWDLRNVFDDFFNDSFFPEVFQSVHSMRADIRETDKEYIVDAEIPGVNKEDIKLDLRDDKLTISVEHHEEMNEKSDNYLRKERHFGSFSRTFYVDNVKTDEVAAKYSNGILTITLPKNEKGRSQGHRIEIN